MTRGTYGARGGDAPSAIALWGAMRAIDHARGRVVRAVTRPVIPALRTGLRVTGAVRNLKAGLLVGGRDEAAKPRHVVGQEFFHSVADRTRAIAMLEGHFQALAHDLALWQTANADAPTATATAQWLAADVTPTLEEWRRFVGREAQSWWTKAATSWETFEEWWDRLRQLRALARAHGVALQSAEPKPLPKTIWQKGATGTGTTVASVLGVVKVAVFTGLTLTGAWSLYKTMREWSSRPALPARTR